MAVANALNVSDTVNTVVIGNGTGFSVLAYSASSGTSNIMSRDSSGNSYANNLIEGYATTVTAAGTTTLTVASAQQQYFTGSTTQTCVLPVVSTLVLGQTYTIVNNSSGVVTVNSSGGNLIQSMAASTNLVVTVILTSGTSAASWSVDYTGAGSVGITTLSGDSGSATGHTVTIKAGTATQAAGSSVSFTAAASTVTLNLTDVNNNVLLGFLAGNATLSGGTNTGIGVGSLESLTTGNNNASLGYTSLQSLQTGQYNTAINNGALSLLVSGSNNIGIGNLAGGTYTTSESSNILLNHPGVVGESNVLRIGYITGTSDQQLTKAFISGINGNSVSNPILVYTNTSTDQLGTSASLITAPAASSTVTSGFGTSLTAGTAVQNTLGYDILINIVVSASLATTATIVLGVGPTSTPTTNTVIPSFTVAALGFYTFSAVVPSNYYVLVNTTGTITIASITVQAMGI